MKMDNISSSLDLPVKFIRYNPDNKSFSKYYKESVLMYNIHELMKLDYLNDLTPCYLFYKIL